MEKSGDDCYFYYYSTCTKGDECPYRHCESALGSEVTCSHWKEGKCSRPLVCKYRHMESRINRSSIQCWFETQPTGCRKPHCVFLHKKPRNLATDEEQVTTDGVILPVVTNANNLDINETNGLNNNTSNNCSNNCINSNVKTRDELSKIKLFDDSDYLNQSLSSFNETSNHINIEPISISINDCDEESDNENELSISNHSNVNKLKTESETNDYYNSYDKNKNYGIKTLEQIRMEKVFNNETIDDINDNNSSDGFSRNESINKNTRPINKKDLRVKIKRRLTTDELKPPVFNDCTLNSVQSIDSTNDFGIKTLDQIRREREEMANKAMNRQKLLKEDEEQKGEKRMASDSLSGVVKIKRTNQKNTSCLKYEENGSEREKINDNISSSCVTSTNLELNELSAVSSSDSISKVRLKSIDTDLDDFDFLDGESSVNDYNAIDDEDDELMREINQVINS